MAHGQVNCVSDAEQRSLLLRARGGDTDALVKLLDAQVPAIERSVSISPRWRQDFDMDDIIQSTFCEVLLRFDRFVGDVPKAFEVWVTTIAQNCVRSTVRALQSAKRPTSGRRLSLTAHHDSPSLWLLQDMQMTTGTPSRAVAAQELDAIISDALKQLPADYAGVIQLYYYEGVSGDELGRKLGRSRGAAYMTLVRAREYLAELLARRSMWFGHRS